MLVRVRHPLALPVAIVIEDAVLRWLVRIHRLAGDRLVAVRIVRERLATERAGLDDVEIEIRVAFPAELDHQLADGNILRHRDQLGHRGGAELAVLIGGGDHERERSERELRTDSEGRLGRGVLWGIEVGHGRRQQPCPIGDHVVALGDADHERPRTGLQGAVEGGAEPADVDVDLLRREIDRGGTAFVVGERTGAELRIARELEQLAERALWAGAVVTCAEHQPCHRDSCRAPCHRDSCRANNCEAHLEPHLRA